MTQRVSLADLRAVLDELVSTGRPVMIEYLMLDGVNDSDGHANRLCDYLHGLSVHVNLIPFNPVNGVSWRTSPRAVRDRFAMCLRTRGFVTTVPYSQGQDIEAACGQLATQAETDIAETDIAETDIH